MTATKITNADRAAVVRDGWRRAYGFAIAAGEPVRLHLGEAFRAAWAAFRQARAEGSVVPEQTAAYEEQYGRSDRAEARAYLAAMLVEKAAQKAASVENHWSTFGPAADATSADEDDGAESPVAPVQLDLVAWLAAQAAMVSQPVQQQQAQAAAPAPDLTTAEGLAKILVGRTAKLPLQMGEPDYTVTGVSRWTSPDGTRVRDYIALETTGMWNDERKGPTGLHIERTGGGRGAKLETKAGLARWGYGGFCNSGTKQYNADRLVRELLAPVLDD